MITLLSVAGITGVYVIPQAAPTTVATAVTGSTAPVSPTYPTPSAEVSPSATETADGTAGRPADALSGWAVPLAAELGIPSVAIQAYGYAELALTRLTPTCHLSWTTLAGIGKIESSHGRGNGATLSADGKALPTIIGPTLNGENGTSAIADTDFGELDGDLVWDHAVGPLQFLPSTWEQYAVDADADGVADPDDIDDAALAAGSYLCSSGNDMSTPEGWYAAIMTYNAVSAYVTDVYDAANDYGTRSHE